MAHTEKNVEGEILKEQCHENFPFLGKFCAKIITLGL